MKWPIPLADFPELDIFRRIGHYFLEESATEYIDIRGIIFKKYIRIHKFEFDSMYVCYRLAKNLKGIIGEFVYYGAPISISNRLQDISTTFLYFQF